MEGARGYEAVQDAAARRGTAAAAIGAAGICVVVLPVDGALEAAGVAGSTGLVGLHAVLAGVLVGLFFLGRAVPSLPPLVLAHLVFGAIGVATGRPIAAAGGPGTAAIAAIALPLLGWAALVPGGARTATRGVVTILAASLGPSLVRPELLEGPEALLGLVAAAQAGLVTIAAASFAELERRRSHALAVKLAAEATVDPLTGLANRRPVEAALAACARGSVILFDLDRFKRINDTLGHAAGDAVLKAVGARLAEVLRPADAVGRVGGEEFVAVLRDVAPAEAAKIAERARRAVAALIIPAGGRTVQVTISAGVAPLRGDGARALEAADRALYRAKDAGRDRVEADVATPAAGTPILPHAA